MNNQLQQSRQESQDHLVHSHVCCSCRLQRVYRKLGPNGLGLVIMTIFRIFCTILVCCTFNVLCFDSKQTKEAHEGGEVVLKYSAPSVHCNYSLYYIEDSGKRELISFNYSVQIRQERLTLTDENVFDNLFVTLTIAGLTAGDIGRYACSFKCRGSSFTEEYELAVFHSPSQVNCSWSTARLSSGLSSDEENLELACSPVNTGYPRGNIICYSKENGNERGHLPFLITGNSAYFDIAKEFDFSCCSVNSVSTKDPASCVDFSYRHNKQSSSPDDITTFITQQSQRQTTEGFSRTSLPNTITANQTNTNQEGASSPNKVAISVCVVVFGGVITVIVFIAIRKHVGKEHQRKVHSDTQNPGK